MSKRPSKHLRAPRPLLGTWPTVVEKADGRWIVRPVTASSATKPYRCPGCDLVIPVALAHTVAWPDVPTLGSTSGLEERRHWHTACWSRKR